MGDVRRCGRLAGAGLLENEIGADVWVLANLTANEVIGFVHPTMDAEEKRREIIEYLQRLLGSSLGCEVYTYGSVPLKTYLPDGDIDLTAVCGSPAVDTLPRDALSVLQGEAKNPFAEYEVKDVEFINAQVKLVKCNVGNTMVDLSFNQLGGLGALCFLEKVDQLVGRNHIFKRSILLIKTWCFYESRLMGAYHGLFSTYALETLVLYLFQFFHVTLDGPLTVLHKFLEYFRMFEWEKYCISLKGPVHISHLPNIVVDIPDYMQNECLLSEELLREYTHMFSTPTNAADTNPHMFDVKFLNIIDPLKETNNLGRSINKGNWCRIRYAFSYGARKLSKVLSSPNERIGVEVKTFFNNVFNKPECKGGSLTWSTRSRLLSDRAIQMNSLSLDSECEAVTGKCEVAGFSTAITPRPYSSDEYEIGSISGSDIGSPEESILDDLSLDCRDKEFSDIGSPENSDHLADLTGDFDNHIRSLFYGQSLRSKTTSAPSILPTLPTFSPELMSEGPSFASSFISKGQCIAPQYMSEGPSSVPRVAAEGSFAPQFAFQKLYDGPSFAPHFASEGCLSQKVSYEVPSGGSYEGSYVGPYGGHSFAPHFSTKEGCFLTQQLVNEVPSYTPQFASDRTWSTSHRSLSMPHSSSHLIATGTSNPKETGTYIPNGSRGMPSRERRGYHGPGNYRQYQSSRSAPMKHLKKTSDKGPARFRKTKVLQDSSANKFDVTKVVLDLQKIEFGSLGKDDDDSIPGPGTSGGDKDERVEKQAYRLEDDDFPLLAI